MTDSKAAASRRAVREFLTNEVGVGGIFTMQQLREAVPNVSQVDRRMRELRQTIPPWVIRSTQSDPKLPLDSYRLEVIGGDEMAKTPSSKVRREVFEASAHRCQVCGIGVGEEYTEYPGEVARLQLGHWVPLEQGGSPISKGNLRTECHRCNGGIRNLTGSSVTAESVEARALALPRRAREDLVRWMRQGTRDTSTAELLYYELRSLPRATQDEVLVRVRASVELTDSE